MAILKHFSLRLSPFVSLWFAGIFCLLTLSACGGKTDETAITIDDSTPTTTTLPASGPSTPNITSPTVTPYYSSLNSLNITGTCTTGYVVHLTGESTQDVTCVSDSFSMVVTESTDGTKTFAVTQEDFNGQISSLASVTWIRDTVPPSAPTVTTPSSNPYTSSDSTLSMTGSCETGATVQISGAATGTQTCTSSSFHFSIPQPTDQNYDFVIHQTDLANNVSTDTNFRSTRDSSIPSTPVVTLPTGRTKISNTDTLTISGSCTTGFEVLLSGSASDQMTCAGSAYTFTVTKTSDDDYAFAVSQRNPTTMISSASVSVSWTRDTVSPAALTLTSPSSSPTYSSNNLTLAGTCETGATVKLTGDDTQSVVCANSAFQFTVIKTMDQTYSFLLLQTDPANNSSTSIAQSWVRDSSLPPAPTVTTPATSPYSSNSTSLTIAGACSSGFTVTLSGDVIASEVSSPASSLTQTCANSTYSFAILKSSDGTYNFALKQTSLTSIDSSSTNIQWILDSTAPNTTFTTTPTHPNLGTSATFQLASTESGTFICSLDGAAETSCSSPISFANLANGSHTLNVKAVDSFGNVDATPASYTWDQLSGKTLALYHLDSADPVLDSGSYSSPYQNNLTNTGSTNNATGRFSQARTLNGSNQTLSAPHSLSLAQMNQRMTVESFIQLPTLPSSRATIIAKMGSSGQFSWELGLKKQGANYRLSFLGSLDGTTTTEIQSSNLTAAQESALSAGFVHVAATFDQGSVKLYFNGVQVATGTLGAGVVSLFNNTSTPVTLGSANGGQYLNGHIDEVRISQVVRWTTGFSPPTSAYTAD